MRHEFAPGQPVMGQLRRIGIPESLPRDRAMVYRFIDGADTLLYVGVTVSPRGRWQAHKTRAAWWSQVAAVLVEWHPHVRAALDAEDDAIKAESPRHNIRSVPAEFMRGSCAAPNLLMSHVPLSRSRSRRERGRWICVAIHTSYLTSDSARPVDNSPANRSPQWMGKPCQ